MMPPPPLYPPPLATPRPIAAFVLSVLSGIWVIVGGLFELLILSYNTYGGSGSCPSGGCPPTPYGYADYVLPGLVGVILGLLILVLGVLLYLEPRHHTVFGALILVFAVGSLVSLFGGFFLGFILGLIGGILAITWRPYPFAPAALPPYPGPAMGSGFTVNRICLKCGRMLGGDIRFCPHCGNPLG
ncbi:MAG: DUF6114 domain-containing protein [Thermoplasmata archaeon]|nr:DUF6114 domain-containing protein [Thermoplasmata archaeon]